MRLPVIVPLITPLPTMFIELLLARSSVLLLTVIVWLPPVLLPRSTLMLLSWKVELLRLIVAVVPLLIVVRKPLAWLPVNRLVPVMVMVTLAVPLVSRDNPLAPVPTGLGPMVEPLMVRLVS